MGVKSVLELARVQLESTGNNLVKGYTDSEYGLPKSWFNDPYAFLDSMGLGYRASPSALSYETLRQMSEKNVVIAAILQTRLNQVASFCQPQRNKYSIGFKVQHRDPKHKLTYSEKEYVHKTERFLLNMGVDRDAERDSFETWVRKVVRDRLTFDQLCSEKVLRRSGKPHSVFAVPADTIRIASPRNKKGSPMLQSEQRFTPKYVQIIDGSIVNEYTKPEFIFRVSNPRTDIRTFGYGFSELEMLINTVTSHLWAEEWNRKVFSQGSTIKGILNVKGNVPAQQMESFKRMWLTQVSGVSNAWRTPVMNSEDMQWIPLQPSNNDMGYQQWLEYLIKIACFVPGTKVTMGDGSRKDIATIEPGDVVRTHTGRSKRVLNVQVKKVRESIVGLRASGRTIRATQEHPFYVASSRLNGHNEREFDEPAWIAAKEIVEGQDYLVVPRPRVSKESLSTTRIDLANYVDGCDVEPERVKLGSNAAKWVPRYLDLTKENAFVLGLYAAEGHSTEYATTFCFAANETAYGEAVTLFAARLGLETHDYTQKKSSFVLRFRNGVVARAFRRLFGSLATKRCVPSEIRTAPFEVQQAFLSGVIAGDGSVYKTSRSPTLQITTASARFANQLQSMLLLQGAYAGLYEQTRRTGYKPGSRYYDLRVQGSQLRRVTDWLSGSKGALLTQVLSDFPGLKQQVYETPSAFLVPVSETWEESYSGEVYNLEVEDEHTYVVEGFAVHNCAVYLIDPSEINFDTRGGVGNQPMFMTTNEAQQKVSKDRGLQPLLRFIQNVVNEEIIWALDEDYEFLFMGMDARTETEAIELRMKELQSYKTLNEVRREADELPPVKDGDVVMNPTYVGFKQQQAMQAQQAGPGGPPGMPGAPGGQQPEVAPPSQREAFEGQFQGGPPGGAEKQFGQRLQAVKSEKTPHDEEAGSEESTSHEEESSSREETEDPWEETIHASMKAARLKALRAKLSPHLRKAVSSLDRFL
jgi:intein/homing endonuclease